MMLCQRRHATGGDATCGASLNSLAELIPQLCILELPILPEGSNAGLVRSGAGRRAEAKRGGREERGGEGRSTKESGDGQRRAERSRG